MTKLTIKDHWASDSLPSAIVVGWFSWWTWCCFVVGFSFGIWNDSSGAALKYYVGDDSLPCGSMHAMLVLITVIAIVLATCGLVWKGTRTWQGKVMDTLAYVVIILSAGYMLLVELREDNIAERTKQQIFDLENRETLNEYEEELLDMIKAAIRITLN